jgi:hypothetical protein
MKARWSYPALFVAVGLFHWLSPSRQGRGILLLIAFALVLGLAIAWLTGSGPRIRSSERDMSDPRDIPIDDHMLP